MSRVVLDLCAGSGAWSQPYVEAGYEVVRVTWPQDVRLLEYRNTWGVRGILAAPPCTVFAASGARWTRLEEDYRQALSVVDACLRLVVLYRPLWWALENPVGKLRRWLGPPEMWFHPCDYGDPYTKKTGLWGQFAVPEKTPVEPTQGSAIHLMSSAWAAQRAVTPPGFARAFYRANP